MGGTDRNLSVTMMRVSAALLLGINGVTAFSQATVGAVRPMRSLNRFPVQSSIRAMSSLRMSTLGDFSAETITGDDKSLGDYVGKPVLILNVASL